MKLTWIKNSCNRQSSQGSATSIGLASFDTSDTFIIICINCNKMKIKTQSNLFLSTSYKYSLMLLLVKTKDKKTLAMHVVRKSGQSLGFLSTPHIPWLHMVYWELNFSSVLKLFLNMILIFAHIKHGTMPYHGLVDLVFKAKTIR